jgi:O-antigen/teichoic acid export membrane protein
MGLQRLSRDTLLYGLSTLLVRGLQIFLIPVYSRTLGSGEYGVVETVAIAGALVNLTIALEISQGMARYIADSPDESARRALASTAVAFAALAYAAFALAVAAFSVGLSDWLLAGQAPPQTLTLAAAAIAINGVFVIVQDLLRWQLRPGSYVMASLAYALGSGGVGIWLVAVQGIGVAGVFWGQLAGAMLGLVVSLARAGGLLARVFDLQRLRTMLRYSLPLVLSGAAVFGNLFIDRIVVRELLGLEALGVYGVTARFASVVSISAVGLQAALSPLVFRHWREPGTAATLGRICRWYLVVMVWLVGGIALLSAPIMGTLTGPAFHEGSAVLPLLTLGAMFSTLYVFAPGLFLGERTGRVALLNVAGALVNLVAALVLTRWFGLLGAALAATISPAFVFAGYLVLGRTWFRVPYQASRTGFSMALILMLVSMGMVWPVGSALWDPATLAIRAALWCTFAALTVRFGTDVADRRYISQTLQALTRR